MTIKLPKVNMLELTLGELYIYCNDPEKDTPTLVTLHDDCSGLVELPSQTFWSFEDSCCDEERHNSVNYVYGPIELAQLNNKTHRYPMDIQKLVQSLDMDQQEQLLQELVKQERIMIHVESKAETFPVVDVYDNTSDSDGTLTILLV